LIFDEVTDKNMLVPFLWPMVYNAYQIVPLLMTLSYLKYHFSNFLFKNNGTSPISK